MRGTERGCEVLDGREADTVVLLDGLEAKREGDVGLSGAGLPEQDDVFLTVDVIGGRERLDQLHVEFRLEVEVEFLEGLDDRETGSLDSFMEGLVVPDR